MKQEEEIKRLLLDSTLSLMEYCKALNEYIDASVNLTFEKAVCRANFVAIYGETKECFIFFNDDTQPYFKVDEQGSLESVRRYCGVEKIKTAKWKIGVQDVKKM